MLHSVLSALRPDPQPSVAQAITTHVGDIVSPLVDGPLAGGPDHKMAAAPPRPPTPPGPRPRGPLDLQATGGGKPDTKPQVKGPPGGGKAK
ncbi:hypothetical protein Hypma_014069 [Hypsizygus marmoreus]|uniref:Uncharacterized protein n=1 Tax=Hypsizygus marmoreus TaxID=39966 RepID=A0A369K578_HYPMA|nr:hypothetical protein Hypma_014069 [Hypsizygus marmoreus]